MEALIYFALWAGLIFLMIRLGCGVDVKGHGHSHGGARDESMRQRAGDMRWIPPRTDIDPVCGKTVKTDKARPSVHDGMVYYFCSRECRERFEAAADLYVGPKAIEHAQERDHAHG